MDKIYFFTPSKTARSAGAGHELAMREVMYELSERRLSWEMHGVGRGSVTQGRDAASNDFLRGDCTKLLMVDDDLIFSPTDLFRLIEATTADRPVTALLYPTRGFDWKLAPEILKRGMLLPEWLSSLVMVPAPNCSPSKDRAGTWLELDVAGGGFMCIHRSALEEYSRAIRLGRFNEELLYDDDQGRECYGFFDAKIWQRKKESEDFAFARRWRQLGRIFALMDARVQHQGEWIFDHAPLATV